MNIPIAVLICAYGDKDSISGVITPCNQEAKCFVRDGNGTSYPCCEAHAPQSSIDGVVTT